MGYGYGYIFVCVITKIKIFVWDRYTMLTLFCEKNQTKTLVFRMSIYIYISAFWKKTIRDKIEGLG